MTDISNETSYPLKSPVVFEGRTVTVLTIRRTKGKDLREANRGGGQAGRMDRLVASLTGESPLFFARMHGEDQAAVAGIIDGFLTGGGN